MGATRYMIARSACDAVERAAEDSPEVQGYYIANAPVHSQPASVQLSTSLHEELKDCSRHGLPEHGYVGFMGLIHLRSTRVQMSPVRRAQKRRSNSAAAWQHNADALDNDAQWLSHARFPAGALQNIELLTRCRHEL